jgi:perosamine synthetase
MIYPRQILYNKNILRILLSTFFKFKEKINDKKIIKKIKKNLNIKNKFYFNFSSRGRTACFHIIKYLIRKNNKFVLMSPFTIFDLVNTVVCAGGKPIFVDSPKNGFGICPYSLEKILKKKKINILIYTFYNVIDGNFNKIKILCSKYNVDLVLDLAISPCAQKNNHSISSYANYSFMSFGIFKFISVIQGGAVITNDKKLIKYIEESEKNWPTYKFQDLLEYYFKGLKFLIATNFFLFNLFVFRIFKFADLNRINFISKHANNDPNPVKNTKYDEKYKKKLTEFQKCSILEQSFNLLKRNKIRKKNYQYLFSRIKNGSFQLLSEDINYHSSYINFPILCRKKDRLSNYLYEANIDHSKYFYRNCSKIFFFKKNILINTNNLDQITQDIITIPIYHIISKEYLNKIIKVLNNFKI